MRTLMRFLVVIAVFNGTNVSAQMTNRCYFVIGPAAGTTRSFPGYPPIPIGTTCNDGAGSAGIGVPNDMVTPRGSFTMSAEDPQCTDPLGTSVLYQFNSNVGGKSGHATVINNRPVVLLRPSDFNAFPRTVARFLLAHECGHHVLGHVIAGFYFQAMTGPPEELAADCFAARTLKRIGRLDAKESQEVLSFLRMVPGDPTTFAGPERVQRLTECSP